MGLEQIRVDHVEIRTELKVQCAEWANEGNVLRERVDTFQANTSELNASFSEMSVRVEAVVGTVSNLSIRWANESKELSETSLGVSRILGAFAHSAPLECVNVT